MFAAKKGSDLQCLKMLKQVVLDFVQFAHSSLSPLTVVSLKGHGELDLNTGIVYSLTQHNPESTVMQHTPEL